MKNPISVIFGSSLKETRNSLNININELVDLIGINISYYRLLESGTHVIHISKTLDIVNAFNHFGANFSYDGVTKIIMGIYYTQSFISEKDKSTASVNISIMLENLKVLDYKLYYLINTFHIKDLFYLTDISKEDIKYTNDIELRRTLYEFLTDYKGFEEGPVKKLELYATEFFKDIPTNQMDIFHNIKDFVKNKPTRYSALTSWDWESKNQHLFENSYIFDIQPDIITGIQNLTSYRYEYLWEKKFNKLHFLFVSDEEPIKYMNAFSENLKLSLEKLKTVDKKNAGKIQDMLLTLKETIEKKVEIKCIPTSELPYCKEKILKPIEYNYNIVWVFSLKEYLNVGVRAILEEGELGNPKLIQGDYLKLLETAEVLNEFLKLWNRK